MNETGERITVLRNQTPAGIDEPRDPAMRAMIAAARTLPMREPDPRIRERVLESARSSAAVARIHERPDPAPMEFRLPGWRWAWAAIFLVCTWGVYTELNPTASLTYSEQRLENELLSLEQELETMLNNLEWELAYASEGWSS